MLHLAIAFGLSLTPAHPTLPAALIRASIRHGVPHHLLAGIAQRESSMRHGALRPLGAQRGPLGLAGVDAGARRLAELRRRTGSWRRAVCAWRWGRADCRDRAGRVDPTGYVVAVLGR